MTRIVKSLLLLLLLFGFAACKRTSAVTPPATPTPPPPNLRFVSYDGDPKKTKPKDMSIWNDMSFGFVFFGSPSYETKRRLGGGGVGVAGGVTALVRLQAAKPNRRRSRRRDFTIRVIRPACARV